MKRDCTTEVVLTRASGQAFPMVQPRKSRRRPAVIGFETAVVWSPRRSSAAFITSTASSHSLRDSVR